MADPESAPDSAASHAPHTPRADGLPPLAPDFVEQEMEEDIDNMIPTRGYQMMPMIGLGGSAGSIGALKTFFQTMPVDSGFAFVVILHLAPEHESTLPELLARETKMPVRSAEDGVRVQRNTVYVIPPGKHLAATDGHLRLTELDREHGRRVAVDLFFRSLADTHGPHATAIVLSGADGDGAVGLRWIKERGGLTIAQDPDEAEHPSMPRTAMDTGMVDWVLRVADMPARVVDYHSRERTLQLPPEDGPQPIGAPPAAERNGEAALRDVLTFLRTRTGRDFTCYKRATIVRRISRRMQVNGINELPAYVNLLRTQPGETGALLKDLLISVTNFFRDRDAFAELEKRIPSLFEGKGPNEPVRAWVPACATGEEAYSIVMLLMEHARTLDFSPPLQVFGCDLDDDAIQLACAGLFPEAITADVSADRLRRFFVKEAKGYRVRREVREVVLFASHDLLKDAPFSRMDLISCRNLLIYLSRDAQRRVFDTLHFALKPGGLLFLGSSESVDDDSPLFNVVDKKHRLYLQNPTSRPAMPVPKGPSILLRTLEEAKGREHGPVIPGPAFTNGAALAMLPARNLRRDEERISWGEVHYRLVEQFAPPSLIVNRDHEIVHMSEHAGRFLQMVGGEPSSNLLRLVHPMLRVEMRALLFRAAQTGETAEAFRVPVELEGSVRTAVDIRVTPARDLAPELLLVVFDARPPEAEDAASAARAAENPEPAVQHLERELEHTKRHLRDTVEQYEASTEELKASNEELQAMNEELRSATEELETSREELQSINEELTTVNLELKGKVDELGHANSDLQNLMASTAIATIFVDRDQRVTRFTPSASSIFNFIPADVARPLSDLQNRLEYPELRADAESVLATLIPAEREVRGGARSFLARMLPYRTVDDRIAGLVLTFVDITERRRAEASLRESEERLRLLVESANDYAIFSFDLARRVNSWNPGARGMFRYDDNEILGQSADILFVPEDRQQDAPENEAQRARDFGRAENERWHIRKDGSRFYGSGSVMPMRDKAGAMIGYVKIMRDLTVQKRNEQALREHMEELTRFKKVTEGRELRMIELKKEINELCSRLGLPPRHALDFETEGDRT